MALKSRRVAAPIARLPGEPAIESSRNALLCVAKKLFAQKGFAGTSIRVLSDLAKVNASLVSYHFGGKRGLYHACISNLFTRSAQSSDRILTPPVSAVEFRLRTTLFLEEMLDRYSEDPDAFKIIYHDLENDDAIHLGVTEQVVEVYQRYVDFMRAAKGQGLLAVGIDPETASSILFSVTNNLMRSDDLSVKYVGKTIRDPAYRKHMIQQIIQIFFDGVTPSASRGTV